MTEPPFAQSYDDVIETLDRMDHNIDEDFIVEIACRLHFMRCSSDSGFGCLHYGGSGVHTWIKSRLRELDLMPECGEQIAIEGHVTGKFHFHPWDVDKYGEFSNARELKFETFHSGVQRSPLSRIGDSSPINSVARKIIQNNDKDCPYCNRYFRNPAALALHIKDVHQDAITTELSRTSDN